LLAPLLFVITHTYILVNLALLADRVRQFHKGLDDQFAVDPSLQPRASEIRSVLTRQLPSNIFVQFLGGPQEIRKGAFGQILAAILWVTLVVAPIVQLSCSRSRPDRVALGQYPSYERRSLESAPLEVVGEEVYRRLAEYVRRPVCQRHRDNTPRSNHEFHRNARSGVAAQRVERPEWVEAV
jgi:hypothetical protein